MREDLQRPALRVVTGAPGFRLLERSRLGSLVAIALLFVFGAPLIAGALPASASATVATGARASARTPPPAPMLLRASEDLRPSTDADDLDPGDPPGWCPSRPAPRRHISAGTVLARAGRLLKRSSATGLRVLRASPDYRSGRALAVGVVAAMGRGIPLAALGGLLRLHALRPRDPAPLVSAAAILTSRGMPNEALSLLEAAARMRGRTRGGMGIGSRAIALNNRGQALIELGRFNEAASNLNEAIRLAPLLSEARTNRSAITRCRNRDPDVPVGDAGRHRSPGSQPAPEDDPPQVERSLGLRSGHGSSAELPAMPGTPQEAAGLGSSYGDLAGRLRDQSDAATARSQAALQRWASTRPGWYAGNVVGAIGQELSDAAANDSDGGTRPNSYGFLAALADERAGWTAAGQPPTCAGYQRWFYRFAYSYAFAVGTTAQWERRYTAKADGLMRVIRSPDARQAILESERATLLADQATAADQLDYLAGAMATAGGATPCFSPSPPASSPSLSPPSLTDPGACDASARGVFAFGALALLQRCETFTLSTRSARWVGSFSRSRARVRGGWQSSLTLIVGPRPGARASVKAPARVVGAGAYLVLGPDDRVTAWGFEVPAAAPLQSWTASDALRRVSPRARPAIGGEQIDIAGAVPTWPAVSH